MNRPLLRPIVVTGTGTNVGKTFASCQLLDFLRREGLNPRALKPVETGYRPETSDASALARAAGHSIVAPLFSAPEPVSPHRAARAHGHTLESTHIAQWVSERLHTGPCLVETAGGLFSPLRQGETMLDLVRALEPCFFLLVAPDRLGTLHDVTSTLWAARSRHRLPDAVVLNPLEPNELENASELTELQIAPVTFNLARPTDLSALCQRMLHAVGSTVHL